MAAERRWIFLVIVLVFLIGSAIYALRQPLEFETGALVRVKAPPLPAEFSIRFHWGVDFWRSPDLAVQVAKQIRISEEDPWPVVSWLSKELEITEAEGLIVLRLRGGFAQRTVRDVLAEYIEQASQKLKGDMRVSIEAETQRLSELHKALDSHRQAIMQALTARLQEQKTLLQTQKEGINKEVQELLKSRQMRVSEQGATLESWYYRMYLESLLKRLGEVERELDLLEAKGIRAFESEYGRVIELEERMESLSQAQVEARQIAESWEPVELVTPAQLPQGPVGPDRTRTILWGVGVGVVVGLLVAVFSPRQRELGKP